MAFCTHCGQSVKDTANFCGHCGHALRDAPLAIRTPPTAPVESPLSATPARSNDDAPPSGVEVGRNSWTFEPSAGPAAPPFLPTLPSSGADAPSRVAVPPNPWKFEPSAGASRQFNAWNQAGPSLAPDQPSKLQPDPTRSTASGQRGKLLLFAVLLAAAGLVLIFVVAPELTDKWTWLWNTWEETTPEYWMAMVGGGVCLLLAGIFLLKAITTEAR